MKKVKMVVASIMVFTVLVGSLNFLGFSPADLGENPTNDLIRPLEAPNPKGW